MSDFVEVIGNGEGGGGSSTWGSITGTLSNQTDLQNALNLKAPLASPTFTGTVSGVSKAMVGLGNADNTSDANKPVSTAQQTAIDATRPDVSVISAVSATAISGSTALTDFDKAITVVSGMAIDIESNIFMDSSATNNLFVYYQVDSGDKIIFGMGLGNGATGVCVQGKVTLTGLSVGSHTIHIWMNKGAAGTASVIAEDLTAYVSRVTYKTYQAV